MRHTTTLRIVPDYSFPFSKLVVSPLDGADLDFISACYTLKLFVNVSLETFSADVGNGFQIQLYLDHNCKQGTLEMSRAFWEKLGKPKEAAILVDDAGQKALLLTRKA